MRDPKFFLPRCRRDGYYAGVQCLGTTECWCSDLNGNPIKNTSTRRSKPKCRRDQRRRTPPRLFSQEPDGANSSEGVGGGHRPCNKTDRMQFNSQLIEEFRSEQQRSGQLAGSSDAAVLEWKFNQLDTNANQVLDRQEVRELKKLVKRVSTQLSAPSPLDVTQPPKLHPLNRLALFSLGMHSRRSSPDDVDVPLASTAMSTKTTTCRARSGATALPEMPPVCVSTFPAQKGLL